MVFTHTKLTLLLIFFFFFFFFENQVLKKTLLNQPKSVTRTWWSCGGTSSINTVKASIRLAYWAKLWARELPDLWVCEKEIQEKTSRLCLTEEIKWPKEVKDFSSLCKAEIINSESPSTIIEGRWSSRAKEMTLITANASTSSEKDGNLVFSDMEHWN